MLMAIVRSIDHIVVLCVCPNMHFGLHVCGAGARCNTLYDVIVLARCYRGLRGGKHRPPLMRLFVSQLCNLSNPALDGLRLDAAVNESILCLVAPYLSASFSLTHWYAFERQISDVIAGVI